MKLAYERGFGWFDDALDFKFFDDRYDGPFPINDPSKFEGIPGRSFLVRLYGQWSDEGNKHDFTRITKACTASQTEIKYYNDYENYYNVLVIITWTKEYSGPQPIVGSNH